MKITRDRLKQIIKEELQEMSVVKEAHPTEEVNKAFLLVQFLRDTSLEDLKSIIKSIEAQLAENGDNFTWEKLSGQQKNNVVLNAMSSAALEKQPPYTPVQERKKR